MKLQVLSATQRGVMRPHERRRRKRPLIAVHMCQIVAFACPGGESEGVFEDGGLISAHMF